MTKPKEITAFHVAVSSFNPYNQLLNEALAKEGVRVETQDFAAIGRYFHLLSRKYDLLHLHWPHAFYQRPGWIKSAVKAIFYLLQLLVLHVRRVPLVWTVHELATHDVYHPRLDRLVYLATARFSRQVIVHCDKAKQLAMAALHLPAEKISVIPHGDFSAYYPNNVSSEQARQTLDLPRDGAVILFFGSIRRNKEIDLLIGEFSALDLPGSVLVIAGWVLDQEVARKLQEEARRDSRLRLRLEYIPDDQVQLFLNSADLLVIPYRDILTSGVIELAASFGLPVVAPEVGCLGDQLRGAPGILYDPEDPEGLRRSILLALRKPRPTAIFRQPLTWQEIGRATAEIYRQALEEKA